MAADKNPTIDLVRYLEIATWAAGRSSERQCRQDFQDSVPDFLLEPIPLGDPPEQIELEIVTNSGTVIVSVNVEPEMVTALDETHGRIDLPPILVSAGE